MIPLDEIQYDNGNVKQFRLFFTNAMYKLEYINP
jgi:hypothetical protein